MILRVDDPSAEVGPPVELTTNFAAVPVMTVVSVAVALDTELVELSESAKVQVPGVVVDVMVNVATPPEAAAEPEPAPAMLQTLVPEVCDALIVSVAVGF